MKFKLTVPTHLKYVNFPDVFIHIKDQSGNFNTIEANKVVLARASKYFEQIFEVRKKFQKPLFKRLM